MRGSPFVKKNLHAAVCNTAGVRLTTTESRLNDRAGKEPYVSRPQRRL